MQAYGREKFQSPPRGVPRGRRPAGRFRGAPRGRGRSSYEDSEQPHNQEEGEDAQEVPVKNVEEGERGLRLSRIFFYDQRGENHYITFFK